MPVVGRDSSVKFLFVTDEQDSYFTERSVRLATVPGYYIDLEYGTRILTSEGYKDASDVKNGDRLILQNLSEYFGGQKHPQKAHLYGCFSATRELWDEYLQRSHLDVRQVPLFIWNSDKDTVTNYLRGLYYGHGKFEHTASYFESELDLEDDRYFQHQIQILLLAFGIISYRLNGKLITKDWQATDKLSELIGRSFGFDTVEGFDIHPKKRVLQTEQEYLKQFELSVKVVDSFGGTVVARKKLITKEYDSYDKPDIINGFSVLYRA